LLLCSGTRLPLEEGRVVRAARVEVVQAAEEGGAGVGEEVFCVHGFGYLGRLGDVGEDDAFVGVVVNEKGHFVKIAELELLVWEVADDGAVDDWAEVEEAVGEVVLASVLGSAGSRLQPSLGPGCDMFRVIWFTDPRAAPGRERKQLRRVQFAAVRTLRN